MQDLISHLIQTYSKDFLFEVFGIGAGTWRQHKLYSTSQGVKGQMLNEKHYKNIRDKYKVYLSDKLREVSDIDSNII